jgi:hypothetical protein
MVVGYWQMQISATGLLRSYWRELMVFCGSVTFVIVFWSLIPDRVTENENTDYLIFYNPVARNIIDGAGLVTGEGIPAIRYPPGYPLFLALVFGAAHSLSVSEEKALDVFTAACVGVSSVFLFMVTKRVWPNRPISTFSATMLWASYPPLLWLTKQPNSEIPFLVFFYGAVLLFWITVNNVSAIPAFFVGTLMGFSMLIRPIGIGTVFVLSLGLWLVSRHIKRTTRLSLIAMMLLGNFVTVLPWEAWVYSRTGRIVFLASNDIQSIVDGLTFALANKATDRTIRVDDDLIELMEIIDAKTDRSHSLKDVVSIQIEEFLIRPAAMAKLYALKAARAWYATNSGRYETALLAMQAFYMALLIMSSVWAWRLNGSARRALICMWLMVFYFWGMTLAVLSILRYMVPAMGLLMILIPASANVVWRPISLKRYSSAGI